MKKRMPIPEHMAAIPLPQENERAVVQHMVGLDALSESAQLDGVHAILEIAPLLEGRAHPDTIRALVHYALLGVAVWGALLAEGDRRASLKTDETLS